MLRRIFAAALISVWLVPVPLWLGRGDDDADCATGHRLARLHPLAGESALVPSQFTKETPAPPQSPRNPALDVSSLRIGTRGNGTESPRTHTYPKIYKLRHAFLI